MRFGLTTSHLEVRVPQPVAARCQIALTVPEPTALLLAALSLIGVIVMRRRRGVQLTSAMLFAFVATISKSLQINLRFAAGLVSTSSDSCDRPSDGPQPMSHRR